MYVRAHILFVKLIEIAFVYVGFYGCIALYKFLCPSSSLWGISRFTYHVKDKYEIKDIDEVLWCPGEYSKLWGN